MIDHRDSREVWRLGLAVWLVAFALFAMTASNLHSGYEGENVEQARAYAERRLTVDAQGQLRPRSRGGVMDVAQYVPFYFVRMLFRDDDEGVADAELFWHVWVHPFWTAWTILAIYALALHTSRRPRDAALCAVLAACGTILWPYSKFGMETQQTLWATASLAAAAQWRREPSARSAAVLGVCLAFLTWTKIIGVLLVLAVAMAVVSWVVSDAAFRGRSRTPWVWAPAALGVMVGIAGLLLTNFWRYGAIAGQRYIWGDRIDALPLAPDRIWGILASPNKSIFLYSPVLILTLPFWRRFLEKHPWLKPVCVGYGMIVVFLLMFNTWVDERWWASRLHFVIPLLALPLTAWVESWPTLSRLSRAIATAVIVFAAGVQLVAVAVNYSILVFVIRPRPQLTLENVVWNPQYNHLRFNIAVLRSWWNKETTGKSLPFVAYRNYLLVAVPRSAPRADVFPMKNLDDHDFFLAKALLRPTTPYGRMIARYMLGVAGLCLAAGVLLFVRATRRGKSPHTPIAKNSSSPPSDSPETDLSAENGSCCGSSVEKTA